MIRSILKAVVVGWIAKKFLDRGERRPSGSARHPDRRSV